MSGFSFAPVTGVSSRTDGFVTSENVCPDDVVKLMQYVDCPAKDSDGLISAWDLSGLFLLGYLNNFDRYNCSGARVFMTQGSYDRGVDLVGVHQAFQVSR